VWPEATVPRDIAGSLALLRGSSQIASTDTAKDSAVILGLDVLAEAKVVLCQSEIGLENIHAVEVRSGLEWGS